MSYTLRKIYKCDLCGKREMSSINFGVESFPNPNWHGSNKKDGMCLCPDCTDAFKNLRLEYYKNLKSRNKSDNV